VTGVMFGYQLGQDVYTQDPDQLWALPSLLFHGSCSLYLA